MNSICRIAESHVVTNLNLQLGVVYIHARLKITEAQDKAKGSCHTGIYAVHTYTMTLLL